ncbi:MAG TPA: hypothetical protein VHZ24_01855 [Pirellulales bacterium]|jgi:hypothetical protein|nr:hypothetical protein [Pirellulales bacterium]
MPYDVERIEILGGLLRIVQARNGSYPLFVDAAKHLTAEAAGQKRLADRLLKVLESSHCFDSYDAAFAKEFATELYHLLTAVENGGAGRSKVVALG